VGPRRARLSQRSGFGNPKDRAFFPVGVDQFGNCTRSDCNSLRDQDDDDFDDLDLTDVIGGNKMFLLNLELQFPISEELGLKGLVFFDMGNAWAENDGYNITDLRYGTGAGVNWFSPFGPITLILGVPLNRLEDEDATVFEFSMGGSSF
jgi:outer membrane protein insertion porin family